MAHRGALLASSLSFPSGLHRSFARRMLSEQFLQSSNQLLATAYASPAVRLFVDAILTYPAIPKIFSRA